MWRIVCVRACWLCLSLAAVCASAENIVYKKVGDEVVLTPDPVSNTITSIQWKDGPNIAVEWDKTDTAVDYLRHFKGRSHLNNSTGALTITGLAQNDSGIYTAEINHVTTSFNLTVISPLPVPTVSQSCNDEKTICTLTCDGNTTGAEPVTYTWKSDNTAILNSSKKQHVIQEESSNVTSFSCELTNPVSQESSNPISNPFAINSDYGVPPNINKGIIVFICLVASLVLLVFIHRCRAGMWFFQKESMPWEGDFWRKEERSAAKSHQDKDQTDEETPMT